MVSSFEFDSTPSSRRSSRNIAIRHLHHAEVCSLLGLLGKSLACHQHKDFHEKNDPVSYGEKNRWCSLQTSVNMTVTTISKKEDNFAS
jgi:hypothetical protein